MSDFGKLFDSRAVFLAPMAGVTEAPFRGICKRMGADLTYTEMISAKGLHHHPDSRAARALLTFSAEEVPVAVQLFGSEPEMMARQAARIAEEHHGSIVAIDINMGCPVSKVVAKGEGSALMRRPALAAEVVRAVVSAVDVPVTVKFRKGWSPEEANAVPFAIEMQRAGAAALAVHGRTRDQFYHGKADWQVIAEVRRAVDVPVIGSGDVFSAADVVAMFEQTGCDAVMVARGAQGNPWIFSEARAMLAGRPLPSRPTAGERIAVLREHGSALVDFAGDRAFVRMRKHAAWYLSELPNASHARRAINSCRSHAELDALLVDYLATLERSA